MRLLLLSLGLLLSLAACAHQAARPRVATGERDVELKEGESAVRGQVRDDSNGLPLSMVAVQAEQEDKVVAFDVSDYQGKYRLGPLAPGNYRITARFAEARVAYDSVVVHQNMETDVKISIDLRPQGDRSTVVRAEGELGAIEGVVLDRVDGAVFPGSVVALTAPHLEDAIMAIADERGEFRFHSLRPGMYAISCYYTLVEQGNVELRRSNIVVAPGETTKLQMKMDLKLR